MKSSPNQVVTEIANSASDRVLTVGTVTDEQQDLNAEANLTFDGSTLTVAGNLTVTGTTTTISTTNTLIADKLIELANGTSGTPSGDAGIVIERGDSTNAAIIWDESRDEFVLGTTSATGASTGDLTVTPGNVSVERLGAGTEQAEAEVHAKRDTGSGVQYSTTATVICEDDTRPAVQLVGSAYNIGMIQFGDNAAAASGQVYYDHSTDKLRVDCGGSTDRLTVDASGDVVAAGGVPTTGITIGAPVVGATGAEINAACDASARIAATVAVADDHILICDGAATGDTRVESLADYATAIAGTGLSASSGVLNVDAAQTGITSVGTIGTGGWQGTAVASAYLDADTAHLSGTQTVTGDKTFSGVTPLADTALSEGKGLTMLVPLLPTTDHTSTGLSAQMLAGGAISAFQTVCVHSVTGEVVVTDSNAIATMPVIGIAPAAISDTNTGTILLQGFIRDDSYNWTIGGIMYASETAGAMTQTVPTTSGAFVQALGVALTADVVYFNPSLTLVEVA